MKVPFISNLKYYLILIMLSVLFTCLMSGCGKRTEKYVPGTYSNESKGYYSEVVVSVTVDAYSIRDITIVSHEEPAILAEIVYEEMPPKIKKKNSVEVDVVSGATYTSKALLDAVEKALEEAKVVDE